MHAVAIRITHSIFFFFMCIFGNVIDTQEQQFSLDQRFSIYMYLSLNLALCLMLGSGSLFHCAYLHLVVSAKTNRRFDLSDAKVLLKAERMVTVALVIDIVLLVFVCT